LAVTVAPVLRVFVEHAATTMVAATVAVVIRASFVSFGARPSLPRRRPVREPSRRVLGGWRRDLVLVSVVLFGERAGSGGP
jgi:hypothetical protein